MQPLLSPFILTSDVALSQVQNLSFVSVKFHSIDDSPVSEII